MGLTAHSVGIKAVDSGLVIKSRLRKTKWLPWRGIERGEKHGI